MVKKSIIGEAYLGGLPAQAPQVTMVLPLIQRV